MMINPIGALQQPSRLLAFAALLLGILTLTLPSQAQGIYPPSEIETNIRAFHYFVEPGARTMEVYAFGDLAEPGVYVVEEGTNLALLIALGGGPNSSNQPDVRQETNISLYRSVGGQRRLIHQATLDAIMDQAAQSPSLEDGDMVTIDVVYTRKMNWRDVFTVIGPILSTLLLIERLTNP